MFEAAKLGRKVSKELFNKEVPDLRTEILEAQRLLANSGTPVVVIISGVEGAGKGQVVDRLNEWLDTRGVETFAFWDETDEERERPRFWRFWRIMPARGTIGILFGSWYMEPMVRSMSGKSTETDLETELTRIAEFERMLTEDGALIVKFWLHLPKDEQQKILNKQDRKDRQRWKMAPKKGEFDSYYDKFEKMGEKVIRSTDSGTAPWYLIEATDPRYRDLTIGRTLLHAISSRLNTPQVTHDSTFSHSPSLPDDPSAQVTILDHVDLEQSLDRATYKKELKKYQAELTDLAWQAHQQKRSTVLVFEGVDAGGKGGAIRRITSAIDSRLYRTIPVAAPTDEEKAHHYLWRFWRHIPRAGRLSIYDRSWYGRVLVERVEGFAKENEWRRSYLEINEFEEQLAESGVIILKFWLQVGKDEQLARFKSREATPYKAHKITDEDWRNRDKWDEYKMAVNEMVVRTSTEYAPWHIIPGNDKPFARIAVLKAVCKRLRDELKKK